MICLLINFSMLYSNKGMTYLVGEDWRNLFDVVIVQARKPKFFTEQSRPLRFVILRRNYFMLNSLEFNNIQSL